VLGLFFGHTHYQREHTVVGQIKGLGEDALSAIGLGKEKSWFDKLTGSGRRRK